MQHSPANFLHAEAFADPAIEDHAELSAMSAGIGANDVCQAGTKQPLLRQDESQHSSKLKVSRQAAPAKWRQASFAPLLCPALAMRSVSTAP